MIDPPSNRDTLREQINEAIAETFGLELEDIRADAAFADDYNITPLEVVDLVVALDYLFSISMEPDTIRGLHTVGDVYTAVFDALNEV